MATPEDMKMVEKGVDATIQVARDYADVLLKPSLAEVGGILADTVGHWRLRNQAKLIVKTKKILEDHGIDPKAMLPDIFVPLLDAAGNKGDELISDMFASLLADHAESSDPDRTHPSYSRILDQLSPNDARGILLLQLYIKYYCAYSRQRFREFGTDSVVKFSRYECLPESVSGMKKNDIVTAFDSAERLGIISKIRFTMISESVFMDKSNDTGMVDTLGVNGRDEYTIPAFGMNFIEACTRYIDTEEFDKAIEEFKKTK